MDPDAVGAVLESEKGAYSLSAGYQSHKHTPPRSPAHLSPASARQEANIDAIISGLRARLDAKVTGTFETGEKNPQRILCSDDGGPCAGGEKLVVGKTAYLYISQQVVDFRKDCLSIMERDIKLQNIGRAVGANVLSVDGGVVNPFYLCEVCARARGLDLSVALADAKMVADTGFAPLRATPKATR